MNLRKMAILEDNSEAQFILVSGQDGKPATLKTSLLSQPLPPKKPLHKKMQT